MWLGGATDLARAAEDPASIALLLLGIVVLLLRRRARRSLAAAGEVAARRTTVRLRPTLIAIGWTIVLSAGWPLVLLGGWVHLERSGESPAVTAALGAAARTLFEIALLWNLCRPGGLGIAHFGWRPEPLSTVRRQLRWLGPLVVVALFVSVCIAAQPNDEWRSVLGRWAMILPLLGLAWFLFTLTHDEKGAFSGSGPWDRMGKTARWLFGKALVAIPLALVVLALIGYVFTTSVLYSRLLDTLLLLFSVILGRAFVMRILLLARRQIVLKTTRERLRLAQAAASGSEAPVDELKVEAEALDLAAVDQATRRLTRAAVYVILAIGCWGIWVDFLPAMRFLETVDLWHYTVSGTEVMRNAAGEIIRNAAGEPVTQAVTSRVAVTLANVLGGLALAILTWIGAHNLPGFLEIAILQRTQLRSGERYAISSLARYVIVFAGGLAAFATLGIGWSQVQWLVAGVSVGLGFGLQEIFANFVSGVILLFERPVRVGDFVTVGGTDGVIKKIHMRATTVRDFDRHELVIPNKDFVTQQVINWSLTDTIVRLVVSVGVAYGSNPEQVRKLLVDAGRSVAVAVKDPEPTAVFRGFGDNSLNFELRAFIASMDDWLAGMNGLHDAVARELGKAGIEISFPQRDLHVRSIGPLREILSGVRQGEQPDPV